MGLAWAPMHSTSKLGSNLLSIKGSHTRVGLSDTIEEMRTRAEDQQIPAKTIDGNLEVMVHTVHEKHGRDTFP